MLTLIHINQILLNHWAKFNQIWCVSYSHEWSVQRQFFFAPPLGGAKGQISFNFNYKVIFQRFLYQTLCVFSQMKDKKHIRRDFHSVAWVMPKGWDFGGLGVYKGSFFFFKHAHVAYQIDGDDEQSRMHL